MALTIHLQTMIDSDSTPKFDDFKRWVSHAFESAETNKTHNQEITIRIVDKIESATLNQTYRNKSGPTNVLSFGYDAMTDEDPMPLGDLVICAPLVEEEAKSQHKNVGAHWAHLTVHGVLHLLGFNHEKKSEAEVMEALEVGVLAHLGYPNPYEDKND